MQRDSADVIDLDRRSDPPDQELEQQHVISFGSELIQVIIIHPRGLIASIHSLDRLAIDHNPDKARRLGALIEVSAEAQVVGHAGFGPQRLSQARRVCVPVRGDGAGLAELVRGGGGVAGGGEGVGGAGDVLGDPGGEGAFEAAVCDPVVGWAGGGAGWSRCS